MPQVLRYNGAVSGKRYKRIMGEDKYDYMALYEFKDEATFKQFQASGHLRELKAEYDKHFGTTSDRAGTGWVQVFPDLTVLSKDEAGAIAIAPVLRVRARA